MKRKFLSMAICLMFCLTSVFMFGGCGKDKPVVVAQHEAEAALNSAMQTLQQSKSIKMTMEMPSDMGSMLIVASEEMSYIEMNMAYSDEDYNYSMLINAWTKVENDVFTTFSYVNMTEGSTSEEMATKTVSFLDDDVFENEYSEEFFDGLDFDDFVEATKLDGELSIVFSEDGTKLIAKIVDNKLVSITMTQGVMSATMYIHYGDFSSEIPPVAEKDWVDMSKITIPAIKTEFTINEPLSLKGLELKFYEDATDEYDFETFTITDEMLEKITIEGFDPTTLTNGTPRTMTITYLGLDLEVEYEVVEVRWEQ